MQHKDEKTKYFAKIVGETIRELRINNCMGSINELNNKYGLSLSRIENGLVDIKFVTLWKIANVLELPPAKVFETIKKKLPEDFDFFAE